MPRPIDPSQRDLLLPEGDWGLAADPDSARDESAHEPELLEAPDAFEGDPDALDLLPPEASTGDPGASHDALDSGVELSPEEVEVDIREAEGRLAEAVAAFRKLASLHDNAPDGALVAFSWGAGKDRSGAKEVRARADALSRLRRFHRALLIGEGEVIYSDRLS